MGIFKGAATDERGARLKNGGLKELKKQFEKPDPPSFEMRNINRHRAHVVFTHQVREYSGKPVRMYFMSRDGVEVGHVGVGVKNRRLYNVMVHEAFRSQKFAYRLMAFIMNVDDPPLNLIATSTNPAVSNDQLCNFYSQFGFKRVDHPVYSHYMEYKP